LGGMVTNDARCTHEIKSRLAMEKASSNKKTLFTRKLDLNVCSEVLHLEHSFCVVLKCGHFTK